MGNRRRSRRRGRRRQSWFMRLSSGKRVMVCVLGAVLCLALSGVIYAGAKLSKLNTNEIDQEKIVVDSKAEEMGEGFTNIAIFGLDSREGLEENGSRSDTIIIASLNNKTKEVKMASVYRDTFLDIGGGDLEKCNAAYSYGGPEQAINMLNANLDLDIKDYITVDFSVVAQIVDAVGGVEINILDEEVPEINRYIGETAKAAQKIPHKITHSGMQLLDGVQATTYGRVRHTSGGDFVRTERQRAVIEQVVKKVQGSNLSTLNKIIDVVFPNVSTSFDLKDIISYAKSFAKYKLGDTIGFPKDNTTDTLGGKGNVVIPVTLESNVRQLHQFLYGESTDYKPGTKVISVSDAIQKEAGQRNPDKEDFKDYLNGQNTSERDNLNNTDSNVQNNQNSDEDTDVNDSSNND